MARKKKQASDVVICDRCGDVPCPEHRGYTRIKLGPLTYRNAARWDKQGRCFFTENDGHEHRRADLDFGTPNGDLMIDPWIQELIKQTP